MRNLLERLENNVLVADGAMGTALYSNGLESCHEYNNISNPSAVEEIHRAYIEAGADIIQTNTYAAKKCQLKTYGYEDKFEEINIRAAEIARSAAGEKTFVLGTIGAIRGLRECELTLEAIVNETLDQVKVLLSTEKIDGLLFETYYDQEEIRTILPEVRKLTDLPIITNISLLEAGITQNGEKVTDALSTLVNLGADIVGLNCHLGPYHMIKSFKQVPLFAQSYLSAYPNASLMQLTQTINGNEYRFRKNSSYFEQSAKLLVEEGVRLIGGCCGTTPEHIRAIKKGIKGLKPVKRKIITPLPAEEELIRVASNKPTIVDKVKKQVTIIAELDPPKHLNIEKFIEAAKTIDKKNIEAITLADNSLASTRICNLTAAVLLKEHITTPTLLHLACRDHNLIGLQSRLMGLDLLGINNILAVTGDPSNLGDFPGATSVFDVTSFKLIPFIKQLNEGLGYNGASLKKTTNFTVAAAYNPNVRDISKTKRLVEKKIKSGADYFITQPVFEEEKIVKLAELASNYPDTPFFVGIMPITSYNNAIFLHNEVPGIKLSEEFLSRLEEVKDDKELCQKVALEESKKLLDVALKHFNGIYLITPFTRADLTVELIDYIETVKAK
ncbi:bifunctional homocysteine S-methyltransferase/methylenetetrahydrofolate reductase [Gemella sanguinis]|jgi:methylenetetrahydrofolate reductase (NAD(P)H)|uniref:bifunctional homocysteine S-methyltransferase/methylenetetrahydrofolate reductase n=1 Tax=Gemella sanguinis TaxID=84135 RepID=UPI0028EEFDB9|nr:bifunctional homocysteine S-methyltransferase/methylenetetrahydrofolate reductase [Gemella sanguinis]